MTPPEMIRLPAPLPISAPSADNVQGTEDGLNFSPALDDVSANSIVSYACARPNIPCIIPELTLDFLGLPTLEANLQSYLRSPNPQARQEIMASFARIFSTLSDPTGKHQYILQEIGQWLARLAPALIAVFGQQAEDILSILMALYDEAEAQASGQSIPIKTLNSLSYQGPISSGGYQATDGVNYDQEIIKKVTAPESEEINDEEFLTYTNGPGLTITPPPPGQSPATRENIDPATASWLAELTTSISHLAQDCYEGALARIRRAFTLGQPGEITPRQARRHGGI